MKIIFEGKNIVNSKFWKKNFFGTQSSKAAFGTMVIRFMNNQTFWQTRGQTLGMTLGKSLNNICSRN